MDNLPINEAVFLLSKLDMQSLEQYQKRFPVLDLSHGLKLGPEETLNSNDLIFAKAAFVKATLNAAKNRADSGVKSSLKRHQLSKRMRLFGQLLSALATSAVLGLLIANKKTAIIPGVVALLSSSCALIADYVDGGKKGSSGAIYLKLNELSFLSETIATELDIILSHNRFDQKIATPLIKRGNELCYEIHKWLGEAGLIAASTD